MGKNTPIPRSYPRFGRDDLAGPRYDVGLGPDAALSQVIGRERLTFVSRVLNPAPAGISE